MGPLFTETQTVQLKVDQFSIIEKGNYSQKGHEVIRYCVFEFRISV